MIFLSIFLYFLIYDYYYDDASRFKNEKMMSIEHFYTYTCTCFVSRARLENYISFVLVQSSLFSVLHTSVYLFLLSFLILCLKISSPSFSCLCIMGKSVWFSFHDDVLRWTTAVTWGLNMWDSVVQSLRYSTERITTFRLRWEISLRYRMRYTRNEILIIFCYVMRSCWRVLNLHNYPFSYTFICPYKHITM